MVAIMWLVNLKNYYKNTYHKVNLIIITSTTIVCLFYILNYLPLSPSLKKTNTLDKKKWKKLLKTIHYNKKYNFKTITLKQLIKIPLIGPVLASRIMLYKKTYNPSSLEDLTKIKGVGKKTYETLCRYIKA